jgi:hypothetical protein
MSSPNPSRDLAMDAGKLGAILEGTLNALRDLTEFGLEPHKYLKTGSLKRGAKVEKVRENRINATLGKENKESTRKRLAQIGVVGTAIANLALVAVIHMMVLKGGSQTKTREENLKLFLWLPRKGRRQENSFRPY